jgi:transposase
MGKKFLRLEPATWTSPCLGGDPLATNAEERVLGPAMIWRKWSLVTQSEDGSAFMARMMTVVMTLRAQGGNVLESMTTAYEAVRRSARAWALLPELIELQQDELLIAA